jgi:hypothetical protein
VTYFVSETGTAPFTVARDALDVRDELRVQADVEAARARHGSGVVNRVTTPSTASPEVGSVIKVLDVKRGYRKLDRLRSAIAGQWKVSPLHDRRKRRN